MQKRFYKIKVFLIWDYFLPQIRKGMLKNKTLDKLILGEECFLIF